MHADHDDPRSSELPLGSPGDAVPVDLDSSFEPLQDLADDWPRDRWAWRARIRANPVSLFWYRLGVGLVGGLMMLGAALTGWLPGPGGIPLFMLGLVVLSSEFAWAHRVMLWFKSFFDRFQALPLPWKRGLGLVCVIAILVTWYGIAVWFGLPDWVPDGIATQLERLPWVQR
ncbi:PGPGW domain-containing protein [Luteococcus sp. Sow4_B9]|uniref:PGPGW domain-containing protein n=1 Tax=Luteococcus sp. Sow4_B9 TaxID=3438792 RepID=UPI003F9CDC9C